MKPKSGQSNILGTLPRISHDLQQPINIPKQSILTEETFEKQIASLKIFDSISHSQQFKTMTNIELSSVTFSFDA